MLKFFRNNFLLIILFGIGIFLAGYKLTTSPPTWIDEGIITQVAQNVTRSGNYGVQVAPGQFISAGFVTTGPSVILPLALAFKFFGQHILVSRIVMVLFVLLLLISVIFIVIELWEMPGIIASLALIVTFSPLYGLGRNVLGEVPGAAFLLFGLALLARAARTKQNLFFFLAGLSFGLAMTAKPLFLIFILPALVIAFIIHRPMSFTFKQICLFTLSILFPIMFWFGLQFQSDSIHDILSIYSGNPDGVSVLNIALDNFGRLAHEPQVIYATLLSITAVLGYWLRRRKGVVTLSESVLILCVIFNMIIYFKSRGYYRYFFPAEILTLIYLLTSLKELISYKLGNAIIIALITFQTYQTLFIAWVPEHYGSSKNIVIAKELNNLPVGPILFWQTPELVPFYLYDNYYQYIKFADNIIRGEKESRNALLSHVPEIVIVPTDLVSGEAAVSMGYKYEREFDRYTILELKNK